MIYLLLKSVHLTAVVAWVGGMAVLCHALAGLPSTSQVLQPEERRRVLDALRWDRRLTSPALLLLWVFGLALALRGGWFGATWLWLKLPVAVALSALHGIVAGLLRRRLRGDRWLRPGWLAGAPWTALGLVAAVVVLATFKF